MGLFVEHVAGVLDDGGDPAGAFRLRADEVAGPSTGSGLERPGAEPG